MPMLPSANHRRDWLAAMLLVVVVSAASYLLLAPRLGFTSDDWYLVYAGLTGGAAKFWDVFAIDRPFRAYFVGGVYSLFGLNAPLYSYLSYVLRVAGALALYGLLRQVWPRQRSLNLAMAVLFAVYPGWSDQVVPFDMQSHLLAVALMIFSMAIGVHALRSQPAARQAGWVGLAVASQVAALLLMEYYIGMEGLRLAILALLCSEGHWRSGWLRLPRLDLRRLALNYLPYGLGAGGFLVWRLVFFDNTRAATDIGGMFSGLLGSPLMRGLWSLVYLLQDFISVTLLAWFVPLYQQAYNLRLRDALAALGLGLLMAALLWVALARLRRAGSDPEPDDPAGKTQDGLSMLWVGSLGVLFALLPVILGERHIVFPAFSRFTLPASPGAVLVLGGLLAAFSHARLRQAVPALLVGLAVMANHGNAVNYAASWASIRDFWWQVSWRAPGIAPETLLAASYANAAIPEDYYVWGPANLLYYPQGAQRDGLDFVPLGAVLLDNDAVQAIQAGRDLGERERRGLTIARDGANLLLMSMPVEGACVHIFDGLAPELSQREQPYVSLAAPYSHIERIQLQGSAPTPPPALFGPEPARGWCYYYQQAGLARQRGDWAEVARLGDEAMAHDLRPLDWVEWMPFVQAYAYLGRYEQAGALVPILSDVRFLKEQACRLFTQDARGYGQAYPEGQRYLQDQFCGSP